MLSSTAPVPILATINVARTEVVITFDQPLVVDPAIDQANWVVRFNGDNYPLFAATAGGNVVTLTVAVGVPDAGIDRVSFAPPPDDVIATSSGLTAPIFVDFPLVTL